jgi:hypothetical protein
MIRATRLSPGASYSSFPDRGWRIRTARHAALTCAVQGDEEKTMAKAATIVLVGLVVVLGTCAGVLLLAYAEPSTEALDAELGTGP